MSSGIVGVEHERLSAVFKSFIQFLLFDEPRSTDTQGTIYSISFTGLVHDVDALPVAKVCGVCWVQFNGLRVALHCLIHLPILYVNIS